MEAVNSFSDEVSIHAPARGATNLHDDVETLILQFQSTLPRGERHWRRLLRLRPCFNPRSRAGSDWWW